MSKLVDEMAEEMTTEIMKKEDVSEVWTRNEVLIFCKCFLGKISDIISEWVEEFVTKEIWKIDKKESKND